MNPRDVRKRGPEHPREIGPRRGLAGLGLRRQPKSSGSRKPRSRLDRANGHEKVTGNLMATRACPDRSQATDSSAPPGTSIWGDAGRRTATAPGNWMTNLLLVAMFVWPPLFRYCCFTRKSVGGMVCAATMPSMLVTGAFHFFHGAELVGGTATANIRITY